VFLLYASQCLLQLAMGGVGLAMLGRGTSLRTLEAADAVATDAI
jgi:hypothetical protein